MVGRLTLQPRTIASSSQELARLRAGVSAGLTCLAVFASRGALHGPMALLANLVSVPAEVHRLSERTWQSHWNLFRLVDICRGVVRS